MADHVKCEHTIECEKRIKSLLKEMASRLTARSDAAKGDGHLQWVAETRAQAVVLTALANRCMENIVPEDEVNIQELVGQVSKFICKTEADVEALLQKGSESVN